MPRNLLALAVIGHEHPAGDRVDVHPPWVPAYVNGPHHLLRGHVHGSDGAVVVRQVRTVETDVVPHPPGLEAERDGSHSLQVAVQYLQRVERYHAGVLRLAGGGEDGTVIGVGGDRHHRGAEVGAAADRLGLRCGGWEEQCSGYSDRYCCTHSGAESLTGCQ